jgi:protein-L-isoaspartate O-methyltransferase
MEQYFRLIPLLHRLHERDEELAENPWISLRASQISEGAKQLHSRLNEAMVDRVLEQMTLPPEVGVAMKRVWRGIYVPGVMEATHSIEDTSALDTLSADDQALLAVTYAPDMPFRFRNIHLSAVSIYAHVLEQLELSPGLAFLNIGSGSGYLHTIVSELIAPSAIHHGVDISLECVRFARERLLLMKELGVLSPAATEHLSQIRMVVGNAFLIDPAAGVQYDRIYCGASVPEDKCAFFFRMLKVGGIMVFPSGAAFIKVRKLSEGSVSRHPFLSVRFADLVLPSEDELSCVPRFFIDPSLQSTVPGTPPTPRASTIGLLPNDNTVTVLSWPVARVVDWVQKELSDVPKFADICQQNEISGADLLAITGQELMEMGLSALKDRRRVLGAIRALEEGDVSPTTTIPGMNTPKSPLSAKDLDAWFDAIDVQTVPHEYVCPIMAEVMRDPVVTTDGHTYERAAIASWFAHHHTDPLTNLVVIDKTLIPNHSLRRMIRQFVETQAKTAAANTPQS